MCEWLPTMVTAFKVDTSPSSPDLTGPSEHKGPLRTQGDCTSRAQLANLSLACKFEANNQPFLSLSQSSRRSIGRHFLSVCPSPSVAARPIHPIGISESVPNGSGGRRNQFRSSHRGLVGLVRGDIILGAQKPLTGVHCTCLLGRRRNVLSVLSLDVFYS